MVSKTVLVLGLELARRVNVTYQQICMYVHLHFRHGSILFVLWTLTHWVGLYFIVYCPGCVGTGSCLYANISICNKIIDTVILQITTGSTLQEWYFKNIQNILVTPEQNLSKCILNQLSDDASITIDSKQFHKLTILSVNKFFLISYLKAFWALIYYL